MSDFNAELARSGAKVEYRYSDNNWVDCEIVAIFKSGCHIKFKHEWRKTKLHREVNFSQLRMKDPCPTP